MFFFFSSRRRHTRSDRDWSSDVCSSDLRTSPLCKSHREGFRRALLLPSEDPARARTACSNRIETARSSARRRGHARRAGDRKSTRLNSSHDQISYAVFCLKKKTHTIVSVTSARGGGSAMILVHPVLTS